MRKYSTLLVVYTTLTLPIFASADASIIINKDISSKKTYYAGAICSNEDYSKVTIATGYSFVNPGDASSNANEACNNKLVQLGETKARSDVFVSSAMSPFSWICGVNPPLYNKMQRPYGASIQFGFGASDVDALENASVQTANAGRGTPMNQDPYICFTKGIDKKNLDAPVLKLESFINKNGLGTVYIDNNGGKVKYSCIINEQEKSLLDTAADCQLRDLENGTLDLFISSSKLNDVITIKAERIDSSTPVIKYSNSIILKDQISNNCSYTVNSLDGNCYTPTIKSLMKVNNIAVQGTVTNLDKGTNVTYTCMVSNSVNGTYTKIPNGPEGGTCVVRPDNDGNYIVVRSPILSNIDKYIKIAIKRMSIVYADNEREVLPVEIYSNALLVPKIVEPDSPLVPQLTLTYSDSKTITGTISNTRSPVTNYTYDCVYTTKQNAEKVPSLSTQFTPFKFNYPSLCTIDTNTKIFKIDLLNMPETLKGDYFAIRVYKNGQYEPVFSKAMPMLDTPCRTPISTDFGKIIPLTQQNYRLTTPFRSTRTLSTKPEAFGWNKQTADFTKQMTVTPSVNPNAGKYAIIDLIDGTDGTDWYDYHVYNICENNIKSQSYCTIRVFNPSKYPFKDPIICATQAQLIK